VCSSLAVTLSRSCDQGKRIKKDWKIIMQVYLIFCAKFQNCHISIYASFSWLFDASLVSRFVFSCGNLGCTLVHLQYKPVLAICASFQASSLIGSSGGLVSTVHTIPYVFCPQGRRRTGHGGAGAEGSFHDSTISCHNFMVYQVRLTWNKFIAAIRGPTKFRIVFDNFCCYFWGQHCWRTETNIIIGKDFFVFHKFPLHLTFLVPPPFCCSSVLVCPLSSCTHNSHMKKR